MSRLVDVEPLEKYLAGLINLARRDEVGIRFPSVDAWKSELEHLQELPTVNPTQRWISVKDSQPKKMESTLLYTNFGIGTIVFQRESLRTESGRKKIIEER